MHLRDSNPNVTPPLTLPYGDRYATGGTAALWLHALHRRALLLLLIF
jgi:hypothetical protein